MIPTPILLGAAAVLAFDTIASLASRRFGFPYTRLMFGSFGIYTAVGFAMPSGETSMGPAVAGGIIGLVDSTIGWAISWWIGPGRLPSKNATPLNILSTIAFVAMLGAFFGTVGGLFR